jgi:hypothetical protein
LKIEKILSLSKPATTTKKKKNLIFLPRPARGRPDGNFPPISSFMTSLTPTAAPSHLPTEEDRFRNIISHDSNSWMLYSSTNKCQMTIIRMRLFKIRSFALVDAAQGEATIVYMTRYTVYQILKIEHSLTLRLTPCR